MISSFFSTRGPLSKKLTHYITRDAQVEMAEAVVCAIDKKEQLLVEAETGTGKTFAYLAPALLSYNKNNDASIIISTGSKALQEQLYLKDLPLLIETTGFTGSVSLLKGRSNYLCRERFNRFILESQRKEKALQITLVKIKNWSLKTKMGDISEIDFLAEDAFILSAITSNNDNCLGRECPCFDDCFIVNARKKAMQADLLVINHHLFFADLAVKETGFGELIPEASVYIFDEAHQLPDIASVYFGESLSTRQLIDLAKDIDFVYRMELREAKQMAKAADQLRVSALDFRLAFAMDKGTGSWREKSKQRVMQLHVQRLLQVMQFLNSVLLERLGKSELLDHCFERLATFTLLFKKLNEVNSSGFSYWFDCSAQHVTLNITPLSVAKRFQEECEKKNAAWIFTSATLSVQGKFHHFMDLLGLQKSKALQLNSPFNYAEQTLFVVPRLFPEPGTPGLANILVDELSPVIRASKGRCFFLCTSHAMMNQLAIGFRQTLTLPVLLQGEKSKQALLKEFVEHGNALLVATSSFWEGVDVRGQTLSCVIIDKLPFSSPEEPLLKARIEDALLKGKDPFFDVQLPQAVIAFKQGIGRLIRAEQDKGVLIVCDNRLVTRKYGDLFLNSLPAMPRTRTLQNAIDFLKNID
ncbi:ATP-dependent helicase, DinG family protein [Psychromonas sp. CNPT3]|uniref:ATP-dependent DNA helicase n=1 Tax=Psychromonas sp. CNPT3 TaxID=314282 RepID=UPI00006E85AC|nr:ATP-dependent DNA helicase [Psychromonas sp. CNPT3]AGH81431.1 ATP-dependent helicase, DinG family protein [Psychromonas sp. CNPT3]